MTGIAGRVTSIAPKWYRNRYGKQKLCQWHVGMLLATTQELCRTHTHTMQARPMPKYFW